MITSGAQTWKSAGRSQLPNAGWVTQQLLPSPRVLRTKRLVPRTTLRCSPPIVILQNCSRECQNFEKASHRACADSQILQEPSFDFQPILGDSPWGERAAMQDLEASWTFASSMWSCLSTKGKKKSEAPKESPHGDLDQQFKTQSVIEK